MNYFRFPIFCAILFLPFLAGAQQGKDSLLTRADSSLFSVKDSLAVMDTTDLNKAKNIVPLERYDVTEQSAPVIVESLTEEEHEAKVPTHFEFRKVPIDGKTATFVKSLVKGGMQQVSPTILSGSFAGVNDVKAKVYSVDDLVWKVTVSFPVQMHWTEVKARYNQFKSWLNWKYVKSPSMCKERLTKRNFEGSGQEYWGFESGLSVYQCFYEFPDGSIVLYVSPDKGTGGMRVNLDYIDRINSIVKEESDMSDL